MSHWVDDCTQSIESNENVEDESDHCNRNGLHYDNLTQPPRLRLIKRSYSKLCKITRLPCKNRRKIHTMLVRV